MTSEVKRAAGRKEKIASQLIRSKRVLRLDSDYTGGGN